MEEYFFQCPYCWENISMLVDASIAQHSYVEDCEVCCNPIDIHVTCERNVVVSFRAQNLGQ